MTEYENPRGTAPLKLPGQGLNPPRKTPTDNLAVTGAQAVIKGTGKLTLPKVNLDDIEIPGL